MNEEHQKQFIEQLAKLWAKFPEWRFGQLIENLNGTLQSPPLFYVTDMELFTRMEIFQARFNCVDPMQTKEAPK